MNLVRLNAGGLFLTGQTMNQCSVRQEDWEAVHRLVERARLADGDERRADPRYPFFQPVTISSTVERPIGLSAFARDVSESGIGLLSYWPLDSGVAHLVVHCDDGEQVSLTGYVRWCRPCGQGWYVAGVSFAPPAGADS